MDSIAKFWSIVIILATAIYSVWLFEHLSGFFGAVLFVCEVLMSSTALIFIYNHWTQQHTFETKRRATGTLDVFVTVVNEPLSIFTPTIEAAANIKYKNKKLYILDDGGREDVQKIASFYGATYISRKERTYRKAGNLNCGLAHSTSEYILVLDADQIAVPMIAHDLLGYFKNDPKIAIVSTRQQFDVPENDFNHDILFYGHAQAGKNADNAAISCGSGVFYRRSALLKIGGFQIWNIVEDLYTSYVLHGAGYRSIYINKPYTIGTAPTDIPMIYKQRGTWALDTLRIFFKKSPLFERNLSFRQKMHYIEMAWTYIVPALTVPILFLLPAIGLFWNIHMVADERTYFLYRFSLLGLIYLFFYRVNDYSFSSTQYWTALSFVFLRSFLKSIFTNDMRYTVTDKSDKVAKTEIQRILPHLAYIFINLSALAWYFSHAGTTISPLFTAMNGIWILFMCLCFFPIIKRGLFPHQIRLQEHTFSQFSLEEPLNLLKYRTKTT